MSSDEENPASSARTPAAVKKEKRFWPLALLLMAVVLAGGGYYTITALKDTARKMGSGAEYDQLAANSSIYEGQSRGDERAVFAVQPEAGSAAASEGGQAGRLNASLIRSKDELVSAANATAGGGSSPYGGGGQEDAAAAGAEAPGGAPAAGNMGNKLKAHASLARGAGASRSKGLPAGKSDAFVGSATQVGKASVQRETAEARAKKNNKGGVLESLKGAFRASFYGARSGSNDTAKNWSARAFDAAEEAESAIEYDEQVKAKLDRVDPNSIPGFLRDQDVSAAEAKRLANSDVSDPKMDKSGTFDALKKDSDYQKKKMASDFAGSMINGLFAGVSGTGGGGGEGEEDSSSRAFSDPDEEAEFSSLALGEYMDTAGFGGECGCTADAPCCCLPQDYFTSSVASQNDCPTYGPFLPDDPCNFDNQANGAGTVGGGDYLVP